MMKFTKRMKRGELGLRRFEGILDMKLGVHIASHCPVLTCDSGTFVPGPEIFGAYWSNRQREIKC